MVVVEAPSAPLLLLPEVAVPLVHVERLHEHDRHRLVRRDAHHRHLLARITPSASEAASAATATPPTPKAAATTLPGLCLVGRHLQDVRVCRIYEGTDEILKLKIAADVLGKDYAEYR